MEFIARAPGLFLNCSLLKACKQSAKYFAKYADPYCVLYDIMEGPENGGVRQQIMARTDLLLASALLDWTLRTSNTSY